MIFSGAAAKAAPVLFERGYSMRKLVWFTVGFGTACALCTYLWLTEGLWIPALIFTVLLQALLFCAAEFSGYVVSLQFVWGALQVFCGFSSMRRPTWHRRQNWMGKLPVQQLTVRITAMKRIMARRLKVCSG